MSNSRAGQSGRWVSKRGRGNRGGTRGALTRQMEQIASVSRSSGLEKDGDALKDFKVQGEYREFIQRKLDEVLDRHRQSGGTPESESDSQQRRDAQDNLLILFRKLREGIVSSKRSDHFALEVYETSLHLAVLFDAPRQVTSIIPHLIPDLYLASPLPHHNRLLAILVSLLYHIVSVYPSQSTFNQCLDSLPSPFLPKNSEAHTWILSLSSSLRNRNYIKFDELTLPSAFSQFIQQSTPAPPGHDLESRAFYTLLDSLRTKARESTWTILQSAYREFSCHAGYDKTRHWLTRSLALRSIVPWGTDIGVDEWLREEARKGRVRQKEGVVGSWLICKVRSKVSVT